jgi:hypothetical protein
MGKIQKIWIAPYKYKGTMFASRDIYTWVEKPDFIVGEPVPTNMNRTGMITPLDSLPFAFQSKELATKKTPLTSEDVKHFVNNVYQAQNNPEMLEYKNEQADSKFDSVISDYLNSSDGKE